MKLLENRKKKKKKINPLTTSAVAAMTAAGVMVGGAMSSPDDALNDGSDAIVQTVSIAPQVQADMGGSDGGAEEAVVVEEEKKKRGRASAVRKALTEAPFSQRVRLVIPFWIAGTVAIAFLSSLWMSALPPLAAAALSWVLTALMAALIFVLAVKTVFPDMPLKKILNRHSLLTVALICLACGVVDAVLPFFWGDYQRLSKLLKVIGSGVCTGVPVIFFLRRHRRKEAQATVEAEPVETELPPPEPTMEEREAAARALVEELADSVCPRAH